MSHQFKTLLRQKIFKLKNKKPQFSERGLQNLKICIFVFSAFPFSKNWNFTEKN